MGEAKRRKQAAPGFGQERTARHTARIITPDMASHALPQWIQKNWESIKKEKRESTYDVVELNDGKTKSYAIAHYYILDNQKMYAEFIRTSEESPLSKADVDTYSKLLCAEKIKGVQVLIVNPS